MGDDALDNRLGLLIGAVRNDDEIQRNSAATALNNHLRHNNIHPNDLVVLYGSFARTWQETYDRLKRADRENDFLRRCVDAATLRRAVKAGEIEYKWDELVALAQTRFVDHSGKPVRNIQKRLAETTGVAPATVAMWQEGTARIPESALEVVRAVPVATAERSREKTTRTRGADGFAWSRVTYLTCLGLLRAKKGLPSACRACPEAGEGAVNRAFTLDAPNEQFIGAIAIRDTGPMDFLELWKIGHALYGQTWKKELAARYSLTRNAVQWDDPIFLSDDQCKELRYEYKIGGGLQLEPQAQKVLNLVVEAGRQGITTKQLESKIPGCHRRMRILVMTGLIFKLDTRPSIYVAHAYREHHPLAWSASESAVHRARTTVRSVEPPRVPALSGPSSE